MGDRLATIDMDQKLGAAVPRSVGGSHITQCRPGRGIPQYQVS